MKEYWANQGELGSHGFAKFANRSQESIATYFKDVLDLVSRDEPILEIGCSVGQNLEYLRQQGFSNLSGVDISEAAIRNSGKYFPDLINAAHLSCHDAVDFLQKEKENSYQMIFTVGVLQNIGDRQIFPLITRASKKYILTKEPDPIPRKEGGTGPAGAQSQIFAPWDYEREFEDAGARLLMKKILPKNKFGEYYDKDSKKCPVLRFYVVL